MAAHTITTHALTRMAQRGIHSDDLDLILAIGTEVDDGVLVRRKDVARIEREVKDLLKRLRRVEGKRVVVADGYLVTAFHASAREQSRLLQSH